MCEVMIVVVFLIGLVLIDEWRKYVKEWYD